MRLSPLDLVIVAAYLTAIVSIGVALKRQAGRGLESYFLGSRKLPWWALAMSGSSSYFDITGTMWIVSLLVILGFRAMWVQWIWGFVIAAFYMGYMGRWIRRSSVMTGSEWMLVRFGPGQAGGMARLAYTVYAVLTVTAFLSFATVGMGKFITVFVDVNPHVGATAVILLTSVYVISGGFQGMVLVEVLQTAILSSGALMICWLGFRHFDTAQFVRLVPPQWWSLHPVWRLDYAGDPAWQFFGMLVMVYVAKGLLLCLSGPEQLFDFQRFLAAADARDAQKLGALWGVIHTIRWPMAMAIAVLAIGASGEPHWRAMIASDPERALPIVLANYLPHGATGLAVAALLSGFLASFSSCVNAGASYVVKDIYKVYINPAAEGRRLIHASYLASALLVALGLVISVFAGSINLLFTWIMGTLGAGVLAPNVFRWYWWRMNGWGYSAGALAGMTLSLLQVAVERFAGLAVPLYVSFPFIVLVVALVTVVASLATAPVPMDNLVDFYKKTGVWGFWGPVKRHLAKSDPGFRAESDARRDLGNVALGILLLIGLYVGPMYLIVHRFRRTVGCLALALAMGVALFFAWYRRLPPPDGPAKDKMGAN
jgi:SSS family solute:Na+ symporter